MKLKIILLSFKVLLTYLSLNQQTLGEIVFEMDRCQIATAILFFFADSEYDIKWTQVLIVLMDNCSTMIGVKPGVETLVRQKNPHLLDVSFFLNELKVLQNSIISQVDSRHC